LHLLLIHHSEDHKHHDNDRGKNTDPEKNIVEIAERLVGDALHPRIFLHSAYSL
jgi:hypothetical protein